MVQTVEHARAGWRQGKWRRVTLRAAGGADGGAAAGKPVAPEFVAGVVPPSVLHQDEIVLLLVKPSLWFILLTSLRFSAIVVLLAVVAVRALGISTGVGASLGTAQQIAILATLIILGRLIWALLVWTSHIYLLTNQRIVTIKGVINVAIYQASLRKIQRTVLYRPWNERILGLGTIAFSTAATGGSHDADSTWVMVPKPLETHRAVVDAIGKTGG